MLQSRDPRAVPRVAQEHFLPLWEPPLLPHVYPVPEGPTLALEPPAALHALQEHT